MGHPGYKWSVVPEHEKWRWRAVDRDSGVIFIEGLANSRPEAAACLVRALTLGVLRTPEEMAA